MKSLIQFINEKQGVNNTWNSTLTGSYKEDLTKKIKKRRF